MFVETGEGSGATQNFDTLACFQHAGSLPHNVVGRSSNSTGPSAGDPMGRVRAVSLPDLCFNGMRDYQHTTCCPKGVHFAGHQIPTLHSHATRRRLVGDSLATPRKFLHLKTNPSLHIGRAWVSCTEGPFENTKKLIVVQFFIAFCVL